MDRYLVWIIAGIGTVALIGTFARMKGGFGPFNLRVLAIVLVATFASLLCVAGGRVGHRSNGGFWAQSPGTCSASRTQAPSERLKCCIFPQKR